MNSIILWIVLRILTAIFAGAISSIKPLSPIEINTPCIPPGSPSILSPWARWDAVWYECIVRNGYSATDGTAQFHPLYPWLATPLARIGISPLLSLLIVGSLAGVALYYFFIKFAQLDLAPGDSYFALMMFIFAPPAFILFAPYAESLFLLSAVLCLFLVRKRKWWLAGVMGGLASLTRQQGIFLLIPFAWELWENAERNIYRLKQQWRNWIPLILIPAGMLVWIIYRAFFLNDLQGKGINIHNLLYSILISPSATKVVPDQQFIWPWQAIFYSFQKIATKPDIDIWVNLISALLFLIFLAISWKKMRLSYRLYSLVITLVSFSYYTGAAHPYMGLPRHLFLAFPLFIGLGVIIKKPWLRLLIICFSAISMSFLLLLYVLKTWVP